MAESIVADVESSMIGQVFYNGDSHELTVTYQKGGTYTYDGVPGTVAQGLVDASSKGKYMHAHILGAYSYSRH
jgi:hypothetical protein